MPHPSSRDTILDAALRCFATRRRSETTVRHVADEAGVSEAAVYDHFASVDALADALFHENMAVLGRRLAAAAVSPRRPVRDRLGAVIETMLDLREDAPDAFIFVLDEQPHRMRDLPRDFPFPLHVVEQLARDGQAEGTVRAGDVRLLAAMALGSVIRPMLVARDARPGRAPDLDSREARKTIRDAAWAIWAADR